MAQRSKDIARAQSRYELGAKFTLVDRVNLPYRLAYVDRMNVVVHDLRSGRRKTLFSDGRHTVACPLAWSPDGKTVFHAHEQLLAIDVRSRRVRELTSFADGERFSIQWALECSPDGSRLLFLQHSRGGAPPKRRIQSVSSDGAQRQQVSALENVWKFKCDWRSNEIIAQTALGERSIVRIDLDDGEARPAAKRDLDLGLNFELMPDGHHVVYEHDGAIWRANIDDRQSPEAIARGRVPSLSPDGSTLAFMGGEDAVYIQRLNGGAAKFLLRARVTPADDPRRMGSYSKAPLWSPDGRLLCVWSTIGTRHDEPRNPEWVKTLRRRQAADERERAKRGAKASASTKPVHRIPSAIGLL